MTVAEIRQALRFLVDRADDLGFDPNAVFVRRLAGRKRQAGMTTSAPSVT
jgi:hypothetical protein